MFLGIDSKKIDIEERTLEFLACDGYSIEFLEISEHSSREICQIINLALYDQYWDECSNRIPITENEKTDKKFLDWCVYHLLERDSIIMASEYLKWRESK